VSREGKEIRPGGRILPAAMDWPRKAMKKFRKAGHGPAYAGRQVIRINTDYYCLRQKGLATKSHETTRKDLLRKWLSATAWSHGSHGLTRIKNINKF
jgi:hypothetical protein